MNWLEKLRDDAQRSPAQPRMPLLWNGQVIGTVAQGFLESVDVDFLRELERGFPDRQILEALVFHKSSSLRKFEI